MRIAFYAPLKPPDHPVPSGDRRTARLFMAALRRAGHDVALASSFRSYDAFGDAARQGRLRGLGARLACRYLERHRDAPPDLWFTYHLYHKAPDWLGPTVSGELRIPYVVAEASVAPKQRGGPWAVGHEAVADAVRRADLVICINPDDAECLRPLLGSARRLVAMKPFLDPVSAARARADRLHHRAAMATQLGIDLETPWIAVVAMMRAGDKLASYRLLGEALQRLSDHRWILLVAGDGPARGEVAAALDFADRVRLLGRLRSEEVERLNAAADIGAWPAINEAFGMAVLEAQAAGLPMVVGDRAGIRQIVDAGKTGLVVPEGDVAAFATALASLLAEPARRAEMSGAAAARVQREHDLAAATRQLDAAVTDAAAGRSRMAAT